MYSIVEDFRSFFNGKEYKKTPWHGFYNLTDRVKGSLPPDILKLKFNYIDMWDIRIDAVLKRFIKN